MQRNVLGLYDWRDGANSAEKLIREGNKKVEQKGREGSVKVRDLRSLELVTPFAFFSQFLLETFV